MLSAPGRKVGDCRDQEEFGSLSESMKSPRLADTGDEAGVGQEMLAARISLVAGTEILGQGLVRAIWTDDEALSTKINPRVAHYTGQAELADASHDGKPELHCTNAECGLQYRIDDGVPVLLVDEARKPV